MLPDAPARFSTTTLWFRFFARPSARMRAATSGVEPAGKPTMIFNGLVGHGVAGARAAAVVRAALAAGRAALAGAAARGGADAAGLGCGALAGCAKAAPATMPSIRAIAARRGRARQRGMQTAPATVSGDGTCVRRGLRRRGQPSSKARMHHAAQLWHNAGGKETAMIGISIRRSLAALGFALLAGWALAQPLPSARPEGVGLSGERLARVGQWIQGEVDAKRIPGAVVLVARNGKVAYAESFGQQDPAGPRPMGRDSIFRIYSMTKPLVSVAAMMMVEEGKLLLEAPVARYVPGFANVRVGVEKADGNGGKTLELVPARRPVTVQDLLRHTLGLTYGFFGDSLVKKTYNEALATLPSTVNNAEFAEALAKLPLHYQPGSTWDYSYSTDVLGRVLEVVDG